MKRNDALLAALTTRKAVRADLPALLALIADDMLGKNRDADATDPAYQHAFDAIEADPNQLLLVAVDGPTLVGMLQLTFIPGLSRRGAWRANIESVRVASTLRGQGVGAWLIDQAIAQARVRQCRLVQLTSDKRREQAHAFYGNLGFEASHVGFKRVLENS